MNIQDYGFHRLIAIVVILGLAACTTPPTRPDGADNARNRLTQLQADPQLASRAPIEIEEAELAVRAAEVPQQDVILARHLVVMADRKVEIARARAQGRLYEDQRLQLSRESETARLDARTREADRARRDAEAARTDMRSARGDAEDARMETEEARRRNEELRREIVELNARETDRGLVMTLGDVLFETDKSELKRGVTSNLDKLATFLNRYTDRTVSIEGHTDNVGSDGYNFLLSQRRADSVKSYLVNQGGVDPNRLVTSGKGKATPVADNDSATGRQQNRRVEVIISNTNLSLR